MTKPAPVKIQQTDRDATSTNGTNAKNFKKNKKADPTPKQEQEQPVPTGEDIDPLIDLSKLPR